MRPTEHFLAYGGAGQFRIEWRMPPIMAPGLRAALCGFVPIEVSVEFGMSTILMKGYHISWPETALGEPPPMYRMIITQRDGAPIEVTWERE